MKHIDQAFRNSGKILIYLERTSKMSMVLRCFEGSGRRSGLLKQSFAFPNNFNYPISMRKVNDAVVIWEQKTMYFLIWARRWDGDTRFFIEAGENSIGEFTEVILSF